MGKDGAHSRGSKSPDGQLTAGQGESDGKILLMQPVLAVAQPGDIDDDEFDPEELDLGSNASTSICSSILQHDYENGRRYHHYRNGRYPLPNDDVEQSREHYKHVLHLESCDGKLFNAPIGEYPQSILDLCTGVGLWAIEVADQYPSAQVTGIDLSPIQPDWVPPNVRFIVDDIEDEWVDPTMHDFINIRHSCNYLKDVDKLVQNCYDHLHPGGWIELSDFVARPECDDGSMPDDYPLSRFFTLVCEAMAKMGSNYLISEQHEDRLRAAGFKNIHCKLVKTPVGIWPKDKTQRLCGMYFREAMLQLVTAMGAKPLKTVGLSDTELEVFLASVRRSVEDSSIHSYVNFMSWWAQKV